METTPHEKFKKLDRETYDEILKILREFNIEVRITSKDHKTRLLNFKEATGNCATGLLIINELMMEKVGVDLQKLFEIDNERRHNK